MPVDAISLAVFRSLFESAAEEMGVTLQRAAFSPNIRERLDFSCAVFDASARMVAQAAHIPVHLGSMPASAQAAVRDFPIFQPGDVVILNDPYRGGTHLPDITLVSPVFIGDIPRFFVASRAHHADVGGMSPGSLPLSTELYQEGIIIPPIKLVDGGQVNRAALALICANSRTPDERLGDLEAQLAAHRVGEKRLLAMVETHGAARVEEHAGALIDYSRRMTESIIAAVPDGVYTFEDALEGDGQREFRIPIRATITVNGSAMTVDFAGSAAQVAGNLNAVSAIVRSAAYYCVRLLATDDLPVNDGCFQPVTVTAPSHSLLNPDFPAAVAVGNTETGQRVVDVVLGALAQALPQIPAASQGTMNNFTFGGVWTRGSSPLPEPFVYYETIAGGHGGGLAGDGIGGRHSHMTNTRNTPVEAIEYALPVRVLEYSLRDESGGAGKYRGGDGVRRVYEFLAPATCTLNTERRVESPYGLHGGEAGKRGENRVYHPSPPDPSSYKERGGENVLSPSPRLRGRGVWGEGESVGGKWTGRVEAGDVVVIETPGGGGYGR